MTTPVHQTRAGSGIAPAIFRRPWLLVAVAVLAAAGAALFLARSQGERAEMSLILDQPGGAPAMAANVRMLGSEAILSEVALHCGLVSSSGWIGGPAGAREQVEAAVQQIRSRLRIVPGAGGSMIRLTYTSRDIREGEAVLRELARSFVEMRRAAGRTSEVQVRF